ncbi:MAG: hypothetical protein Q4C00_05330, partial [Bacillota bacterium]|nr:hypothetical protein [Bacillota bacterium]
IVFRDILHNNGNFRLAPVMTDKKDVVANTDSNVGNPVVTEVRASEAKNLSNQEMSVSVSLAETTSESVVTEINGRKSHSYSASISLSTGGGIIPVNVSTSFTAEEFYESGWSSSKSLEDSTTYTTTVAVPLDPYTQALISTSESVYEETVTMNYPVALLFDVTIAEYLSVSGQTLSKQLGAFGSSGGSSARANLYTRSISNASLGASGDPNGID